MSTYDELAADSLVSAAATADESVAAARTVAAFAVREGWARADLREVLGALGLTGRPSPSNAGIKGCPSQAARQRHIREGRNCCRCWPGGRTK